MVNYMKSQYQFFVSIEHHPFAGEGFKISREIKLDASVIKLTLHQNGFTGIGECVALKRYGHTVELLAEQINVFCQRQSCLDDLENLQPGPARFALDTALTQLMAQKNNQTIAGYLGITVPLDPIATAFTLSLDTPEKMQQAATQRLDFATLKLKQGNDDLNIARLEAISAVAPHAKFILDANEALTPASLEKLLVDLQKFPVILMEQPLPAGNDEALRDLQSPIPFAADESCHTLDQLAGLQRKYQVVNLKLDKTGGLHHAMRMVDQARVMGFDIMIGCMGSTSLSIYPAYLLAAYAQAKYNDLDGALLLARDPYGFVTYKDGQVTLAKDLR